MTYVLVNPFPWRSWNGVTSYLRALQAFLGEIGVASVCISNDEALPRGAFQRVVRDTIIARFRPEEIVIEAPEVECPTLLVPPQYRVHIRLHCPLAIVEAHNGRAVDWSEFDDEIAVARRAHVVSSPSYALLRVLDPHLATESVHVYKNPPPLAAIADVEKRRDLAFLARFRRLKGNDFLESLLRRLPVTLSVAVAGRGSDQFIAPGGGPRDTTVHGEIVGDQRLRFLGEARAALVLSRFENCPMTVLESLAMNTIVVGWHVGGIGEIAPSRLVRLVPLGEVEELVATIDSVLRSPYPEPREFLEATARIKEDFRNGWSQVWNALRQTAAVPLYRGMDCSTTSAGSEHDEILDRVGDDSVNDIPYPAARRPAA
jgi:glycosyltransferase involved in cell wall biosynthesis